MSPRAARSLDGDARQVAFGRQVRATSIGACPWSAAPDQRGRAISTVLTTGVVQVRGALRCFCARRAKHPGRLPDDARPSSAAWRIVLIACWATGGSSRVQQPVWPRIDASRLLKSCATPEPSRRWRAASPNLAAGCRAARPVIIGIDLDAANDLAQQVAHRRATALDDARRVSLELELALVDLRRSESNSSSRAMKASMSRGRTVAEQRPRSGQAHRPTGQPEQFLEDLVGQAQDALGVDDAHTAANRTRGPYPSVTADSAAIRRSRCCAAASRALSDAHAEEIGPASQRVDGWLVETRSAAATDEQRTDGAAIAAADRKQ